MNILVPTMPDDTHAIYVHLALQSLGHNCFLWYTADIPSLQTNTFLVNKGKIIWLAKGKEFAIDQHDHFDVVWYRRPRKPILPVTLHPDDQKIATKENMIWYHSLWHIIAPDAFWINNPEAAIRANCKLLQLKIASAVGLNVPETIVSNDPAKIKNFISKHETGEVIYKPLYPPFWSSEKSVRLTYTDTIKLDDLPMDSVLQVTPGIFQKKIYKAFELRITMMGTKAIAVKINSQKHPKGIMDWRYVPGSEMEIEKFTLPEEITKKIITVMKTLGIVFGCFDFIVTPSGEYYFLEVNEQGQFLWVEDLVPEIKMLNSFINFLLSCDKSKSPRAEVKPYLKTVPSASDAKSERGQAQFYASKRQKQGYFDYLLSKLSQQEDEKIARSNSITQGNKVDLGDKKELKGRANQQCRKFEGESNKKCVTMKDFNIAASELRKNAMSIHNNPEHY